MSRAQKIFHESWYQIANQKIVLRSSVKITRQLYRGEQWYVLHDPFSNQFYRLRYNAYEFIARLSRNKTIEEIWFEMLEHTPDRVPGQGEIIDLLSQLYHANLLHYDLASNSITLFERHKKRKQNMVRMQLLNILFARIPLFDPEFLLKKLSLLIRFVFSPAGLVIWMSVVGIGLKSVLDNFSGLKMQTDGILAPENLPLLYAAIAFIKIFHEIGHAFAVHRFGGEVHTMGIMFLLLTPLPYTDASASTAFRSKWQRLLVGASGMIFELFIGAIAAIVWVKTGDGIIHSIAYNALFAATVTTLLFNINPLMRYDGYYMLCDITEVPNLQQLSAQQLKYSVEKYAFGLKTATSPSSSASEAWLLSVFSIASTLYRVVVFSGILLAISKRMLLLAAIMACFMLVSWLGAPLVKFIKYITQAPELQRVRNRAIRVTLITLGSVFAILAYLPIPYTFKAPGVVKAIGFFDTVNESTGKVVQLYRSSGSLVTSGDTLYILENIELRQELYGTQAALREAQLLYNKALTNSQADLEPIEQRINALKQRAAYFSKEVENLIVRAKIDGTWFSPDADDNIGRWMPRGTPVGTIIDQSSFYFSSAISQREIANLFMEPPRTTTLRLFGKASKNVSVANVKTIPMEQNRLPSTAMGFIGGGEIPVVASDSSGRRTMEPFYEVRAEVIPNPDVELFHGRTGKIRFFLGYKPALWQGWRKALQLLQKHYKI